MAEITITRVACVKPDGKAEEVELWSKDKMAYADLRGRKKWPAPQDDPERAVIVQAYFAMRRTGKFSGSLDEFTDTYAAVVPVDEVAVGPTSAG